MFTLRNKRTSAGIFLILLFAISIKAQNIDLASLIFSNTETDYMGQIAISCKARHGMGIYKDGKNIYIGDFSNNKKTGYGMMIIGNQGKIKNLPDCMAYIGDWYEGKKEGNGTCYNKNGDIIYVGKFENDKPIGPYPMQNPPMEKYFSLKEIEDGVYIGENSRGYADGFGLTVTQSGTLCFGRISANTRYSVTLEIYSSSSWRLLKYEGDNIKVISTSEMFASKRKEQKEASDRFKAQLWDEFIGIANGIASTSTEMIAYSQRNKETGFEGAEYSNSSYSGSSNNKQGKHKSSGGGNDCGTAWHSDSRSYSDAETLAIKATNESDFKAAQNRMRRIRQKWEARGCPITESVWETKPFGS